MDGQDHNGLIRTEDLVKDYVLEAQVVHALQGVSVTIQGGEMVTVMGPSGSGKSAAPSRSAPACPAMKVPTE